MADGQQIGSKWRLEVKVEELDGLPDRGPDDGDELEVLSDPRCTQHSALSTL